MATCERCGDQESMVNIIKEPGPAILFLCAGCTLDLTDVSIGRVIKTHAGKRLRIDFRNDFVWKGLKDV